MNVHLPTKSFNSNSINLFNFMIKVLLFNSLWNENPGRSLIKDEKSSLSWFTVATTQRTSVFVCVQPPAFLPFPADQ